MSTDQRTPDVMSDTGTVSTGQGGRSEWLAVAALVVFGCALLGSTIMWSWSGGADVAELTMCGTLRAVPHTPGYPLWTNLAWLATQVGDSVHPAGRIAVLVAALAIAAAVCTRGLIRDLGGGMWSSTGFAGLVLTIPICIRAFSVPEVYSLDLLLIAACARAFLREHDEPPGRWTAVGLALAVLAVGHRPVNILLLLALLSTRSLDDLKSRFVVTGFGLGLGLQGVIYLDLWMRIHSDATAWVAMGAVPGLIGFSKFVAGLTFSRFLDVPSFSGIIPALGLQAAAVAVVSLAAPWVVRPQRVGWAVFGYAVAHIGFVSVYRISDVGFLCIPLIWAGVVVLGVAAGLYLRNREKLVSVCACAGLCLLGWNNRAVMDMDLHQRWQDDLLNVLASVPEDAVVISDDWPVRTGLVAMQKVDGRRPDVDVIRLVPDKKGARLFAAWFHTGAPVWQTEERQELTDRRTVRIHDERMIVPIEAEGFLASPAEAGTWSVEWIEDEPEDAEPGLAE